MVHMLSNIHTTGMTPAYQGTELESPRNPFSPEKAHVIRFTLRNRLLLSVPPANSLAHEIDGPTVETLQMSNRVYN